MAFTKLKYCLSCGKQDLKKVLNLNKQPLANSYTVSVKKRERKYDLIVNCCLNCTHLQLSIAVDPKKIYKKYDYVSGTSKTYLKYMKNFYSFCIKNTKLSKNKNILDIGCNDGSQLDIFKKNHFKTFGVDPATNIYKISSKKHNVICEFFNEKVVKKLNKKFNIIILQNSFAHNPNPLYLLQNIKKVMHKNSCLFIQTSQADMCQNNEFDTIYHEHINFFNVKSMNTLASRAGMKLHNVVKKNIHGTSYIFVLKLFSNQNLINKIIKKEEFLNFSYYKEWGKTCLINVKNLKNNLSDIKKNKIIIGYGAAAKANTFLNFAKIKLNFIVDDNKLKQNKYCPGSKIQIKSIDYLKKIKDDIVVIPLAWNYYKEIKEKVTKIRNNKKDKFIVFFPKFKIE